MIKEVDGLIWTKDFRRLRMDFKKSIFIQEVILKVLGTKGVRD